MPELTWPNKRQPELPPARLIPEAVVFPRAVGYPQAEVQNRLIGGDNLKVMAALLQAGQGELDLIYTDPPFFTNRRFKARIGRGEDSRKPEAWQMAEGYLDDWQDLDAYLDMLYPRLVLMHRLLASHGTLYLHLDWHAAPYARLLLDEIFGPERLLNEIAWVYHGPSPIRTAFNRKHDTILVYTKTPKYTFNADAVREPYNANTVRTFASSPKAGFGKVPNLARGKVPEDWWYFPVVARLHKERTGYPTQKPEALLERVILASSHAGERVADFFSGSGTTAAVAARLGRRFLAVDAGQRAVHTAQRRLAAQGSSPFFIEYEADFSGGPALASLQAAWCDGKVCLEAAQADALDYWEVDPAYDGQVFRSARQAVRGRQTNWMETQLEIQDWAGRLPICVRGVRADGAHLITCIERSGR